MDKKEQRKLSAQDMKDTFARNLKKYAKRRGRLQSDICRELNLPEMTVSNWFNAKTYPRADKIRMLADFFDINISDLTENTTFSTQDFLKRNEYPYLEIFHNSFFDIDDLQTNELKIIELPSFITGEFAGDKDIFLTKIETDSMDKTVQYNTLAVLKRANLSQLKDGDIVLYKYKDVFQLRLYFYDGKNKRIIFRPNSHSVEHTDRILPLRDAADVQIIGRIVVYLTNIN